MKERGFPHLSSDIVTVTSFNSAVPPPGTMYEYQMAESPFDPPNTALCAPTVYDELGVYNGTRYIVTKINYRTLTLEKMGVPVDETTSTLIVPRIIMTSDSGDYPFELRRRQFPVRVAFAMTVNKSQGQTLKRVGVYLPQPIFAHGALYVALSRVGSKDAIKFFIQQPKIKNIEYYHTKNIVYKL